MIRDPAPTDGGSYELAQRSLPKIRAAITGLTAVFSGSSAIVRQGLPAITAAATVLSERAITHRESSRRALVSIKLVERGHRTNIER
jgi:hypothetical protein